MTTPKIDVVDLTGTLCCISSYFNPIGWKSRYDNFCIFYERMLRQNVNLLIGEVALHDRGFQLQNIVNEEHLAFQLCAPNILWHKESVLSLLLGHLPANCDKVCWIDADILVQNNDWVEQINNALNMYRVVQGFNWCGMLPHGVEDVDRIGIHSFPTGFQDCHKCYSYINGLLNNEPKYYSGQPGIMWAARRSVLERIGFYKHCVLGGADYLTARAMAYKHYDPKTCELFSKFNLATYFPWAQNCAEQVDFSINYVSNVVYHLYHGHIDDRGHNHRLQLLRELEFDPRIDINELENGLCNFTDIGERFMEPTKQFFIQRKE